MAKEVAIGKRAKISEAQKYMLLAVLGTSIVLGAAISFIVHFVQVISFNTEVIMAEEESIANYSKIIESTGTCIKPSGGVYSNEEIEKCNPNAIEVSQVPGTLRANIIENLAANEALNSVPRRSNPDCIDSTTGKSFTYKQLSEQYKNASGATELQEASQRFKSCSALRVIPDSLPAYKNEDALLASLNKIFLDSNWTPESLSPSGDSSDPLTISENINSISVSLSIEANTGITKGVLNNIERSIREFDIQTATIEWGGDDTLVLQARANAYYTEESAITETEQEIKAGGKK